MWLFADTECWLPYQWQRWAYRHDVASLCMQIGCSGHWKEWRGLPGCKLAAASWGWSIHSLSMDQHGRNPLRCILRCCYCCCHPACCNKRHRWVDVWKGRTCAFTSSLRVEKCDSFGFILVAKWTDIFSLFFHWRTLLRQVCYIQIVMWKSWLSLNLVNYLFC